MLYKGAEPLKQDLGVFTVVSRGLNGTVLADSRVRFTKADNSVGLFIRNNEVFRAEYSYNDCNKLSEVQMLLKRSSGYFKQTKQFSYDDDAQILEVKENNHVWRYEYDQNGNMIKLKFGTSQHQFDYNENDQLVFYNGAKIQYDGLGRVVSNYKKMQFHYGSGSLLSEVTLTQAGGRKINYFYDHLDRLGKSL